MIKPTIGRVVWYHPAASERIPGQPNDQVLKADITYVWSDRMVNLMAVTPNGAPYGVMSVTLVQEGDAHPIERFCQWMPYQVGQAKKHEPEAGAAECGAAVRAAGLVGTGMSGR